MSKIDELNAELQQYVVQAENIKSKVKLVAENKEISIINGEDTPESVLDKINSGTIKTPTETISIIENGTIDVTNYANADVNIVTNLIEKTITNNGTYLASAENVDGFSKVIVEVQGGQEEPEPVTTSPALFAIDGPTIREYIGTETDVIIPVSYSRTYNQGTADGVYISSSKYSYLSNINYMISMTFTDDSKTMTFSSFDTLESDLSSNFPNDCYLIYAQADHPYAFDFLQDFYNITI